MQPFLKYAGGKWRSALQYPPPKHKRIVEPFAGSAGYSTRYPDREVILIDSDERVVAAWRFLLRIKREHFLRLPILEPGEKVSDQDLAHDAQAFLSFRMNVGAGPRDSCTRWQCWNEKVRAVLANQLEGIRHWKVLHGDWQHADLFVNDQTTTFVDPPYQHKQFYRDKVADYGALARFCQSAPGQVIVCEGPGADWLPFEHLTTVKAHQNAAASTVQELIYAR